MIFICYAVCFQAAKLPGIITYKWTISGFSFRIFKSIRKWPPSFFTYDREGINKNKKSFWIVWSDLHPETRKCFSSYKYSKAFLLKLVKLKTVRHVHSKYWKQDFFSGHYINLDIKIMKTSAAFCNKIWQASRFYFQAVQRLQTDSQKWQKYRKDVENLTENEKIDLISRRYLRPYWISRLSSLK